jgi:hypothetical protein
MDDAQLRTVWQQRRFDDGVAMLGQPLASLMKHTLAKKVRQLSRIAELWDEFIPESLRDHTALESFHRGVLTVLVDSAAHRFQLQTLMDGGLIDRLRGAFPGGLDKVRLVLSHFQAVELAGRRGEV